MRILRDPAFRLRHAHQTQHLDRASRRILVREAAMQHQDLGNLIADGQHRVERCHRLLEDHGDRIASDLAHLRFGQLEQIAPFEDDPPGDRSSRRRRNQAQDRERRDALPAARFAHDRQRLAARDRERYTVDGAHHAVAGEEIGLQLLDLEQRRRRGLSPRLILVTEPGPNLRSCLHGRTWIPACAGMTPELACRRHKFTSAARGADRARRACRRPADSPQARSTKGRYLEKG